MKVTFGSHQTLGDRLFKKGTHEVPDHLASNLKFKNLVRGGFVTVHAKTAGAVAAQISKDEQNKLKAEIARKLTLEMNAKPVITVSVEAPKEAQKEIPAPQPQVKGV